MKIEDYIKSLPEKIITGEDVQLSASTLREILEFADIGEKDVFYHLGCGDGAGPAIATEYGARAIGIDALRKNQKTEKIHTNSNDFIPVFLWIFLQRFCFFGSKDCCHSRHPQMMFSPSILPFISRRVLAESCTMKVIFTCNYFFWQALYVIFNLHAFAPKKLFSYTF